MNYTKNYHLPQWVASDRIMMEDFNDMNNSIESGLNSAAQATARAEQSAKNAENSAAAAAAARPYVTGTYVGMDRDLTINLGFRPAFVIVSGMAPSNSDLTTNTFDRFFVMTAGRILKGRIDFTDTGFIVRANNSTFNPYLTESKRTYDYIAFK